MGDALFENRKLAYATLMILICGCLLPGCNNNDPAARIADANRNNVQRLANLYGSYQSRNGWMGPKDRESFIKFIESMHPTKLERMGIDANDIPAIFVSDRDEQEMKIRYSVKGGMGVSAPVVFESEGVGGIRRVGYTAMRSEEADAARYEELWSGKGDSSAMSRDEGK